MWASVLGVGTATIFVLTKRQLHTPFWTVLSAFLWVLNPFLRKIKKVEKTWKKVLTNGGQCDSICGLSPRRRTIETTNRWRLDWMDGKINEFGLRVKRVNSLKGPEKSSWQSEEAVVEFIRLASGWQELLKKFKKFWKKFLTNAKRHDNICKLTAKAASFELYLVNWIT